MIGVELPVYLNLNFRSKFKLNLLCRLDVSCGPAAAAPPLRLPVSSGKYGPCRLSDAKGQAASSQPAADSRCAAAQTAASVELSLDLNFPPCKLTEVRAMMTLAFTGQVLAFKGPVLVKPIITRMNFENFEIFEI